MKFKIKLFAILLFFFIKSDAQTDTTQHTQISVITCAPGNDLYSIFGHTAIRIIDSLNNTDLFYNYGTFNFNDPQFYTKFVKGKLDYFLNTDNATDFFLSYQQEGRTIYEQVLNLTNQQKKNHSAIFNK